MEIRQTSLVTFLEGNHQQGGVVTEIKGDIFKVQTLAGDIIEIPSNECTEFKVRTKKGAPSTYALSRLKSYVALTNRTDPEPTDFSSRYEELKKQNAKLKKVLSAYTDIIVGKLINPKDNSEVIASLTELVNDLVQND